MKKKYSFVVCLILFLNIFTLNATYAKSDAEKYVWQKINNYYTGRNINAIAYGENQYVAVGDKGLILTSQNGISWKLQYCGYEDDFFRIAWNGKIFEATTKYNKVISSNDGITWSLEASNNLKENIISKLGADFIKNNNITQNKLFGYIEGKNEAIAVGGSGAIYYGTKKEQKTLKQAVLTTDSQIIDKLGNAVILCVGTTRMYVENNIFTEPIPKPYTVKTGKKETTYIPLEKVVKGIGGSYKYDSKSSIAYITYKNSKLTIKVGSKTVKVNGKNKTAELPAQIKNNIFYAPLSTLSSLGKQVCLKQKLIVISDIKNFFNKEEETLMIKSLVDLSLSNDYYNTSLSNKLVDTLIFEGDKLYNEKNYVNALKYYLAAEAIEPNSVLYYDIGATLHWQNNDNDAITYYDMGIKLNSIDCDLYKNKGDSLCRLGEYDKATEYFDKAEIIMCGNENGLAKYSVIHSRHKSTYENKEREWDVYSLLIQDKGTWKFYYALY